MMHRGSMARKVSGGTPIHAIQSGGLTGSCILSCSCDHTCHCHSYDTAVTIDSSWVCAPGRG